MKPHGSLNIRVISGDALTAAERHTLVALCNRAYGENLGPLFDTFAGPTHLLGSVGGKLVSHALWVTRYLQPGELPPLRTAYVEMVATAEAYRNRGYASALMRRLAEEVRDFDLAALSPSSPGYYERLGWECWRGPLFIRTAEGPVRSPEDEEVMILRLPKTPALDLTAPLSAEWREGELW
jgi:aminoglycoside 2'-N-acetyltransferase I